MNDNSDDGLLKNQKCREAYHFLRGSRDLLAKLPQLSKKTPRSALRV